MMTSALISPAGSRVCARGREGQYDSPVRNVHRGAQNDVDSRFVACIASRKIGLPRAAMRLGDDVRELANIPCYSQRNACIGSIAVARRAGIYPASTVTAAIPSEAAAMVSKSVG